MDSRFLECSSPSGFKRFECLRSAPVVAGERPADVLRRLVLSKRYKERHPMDGSFFYVRVLPGSNGSNVYVPLRSSQSNVPRTFCDVSFSPWWSDFGYFQGSAALIVDVNFLGAVLALRIADSMDNDLLDKLMQDTWSQFRNFRIPFYNGEKPLHLRTPAESRQAIFFV